MIKKFWFNGTWIKEMTHRETELALSEPAQWWFTLVAQVFHKPVVTSYSPTREAEITVSFVFNTHLGDDTDYNCYLEGQVDQVEWSDRARFGDRMRNPLPGPPALATLVLQEQPSRPFTPEAPSPTRATLVCDHIGLRKSRFFSARFSHMQKTVTLLEKNKLQQFQKGRELPGNWLLF